MHVVLARTRSSEKGKEKEYSSPLERETSHFSSHEVQDTDQNRSKYSNFTKRRSSALGPPISNWTTHVASSVSQLNTLLKRPSSKSSVQATNDRKPNVEIARRAEEVHFQLEGKADHRGQGQVGEGQRLTIISMEYKALPIITQETQVFN